MVLLLWPDGGTNLLSALKVDNNFPVKRERERERNVPKTESRLATYFTPARAYNTQIKAFASAQGRSCSSP